MQTILTFALALMIGMANTMADQYPCLPKNVVRKALIQSDGDNGKPMTVAERLAQLKARCKKGKLVELNGREIRFVELIGCWGNPPADYQEQLDRQQKEVKELSEKYTVIQIPCSQSKDPTKIH